MMPINNYSKNKRLMPKPKKPLPPGGIPTSVGGGDIDNDEIETGLKKRKTIKSRMMGIRGRFT
jgi:hypothetical protein